MTSNILRKMAFALTISLGGSSLVAAQPPVRTAPPPPPPGTAAVPPAAGSTDPNAVPQAIRAKQILGTKISLQGNTGIGTVEDIVFTDAGEVEYLIVDSGGKLVTVPWSAATFNFPQKTAVVNITPEQYKVIPTYTATTYPEFFTPTYRTEVYKYYGLTPGQLRRMERRLNRP
ncbi:MAG: PRC-barrel domain protein [Gemmataceae bacterium]|nr:PRC-barrel domain protein [Gemmataceae bacterium]